MSFKQHLELAQSFQNEMADVDGLSVIVSVYVDRKGKFASIAVMGRESGNDEHFFHVIGDKITAESLAEIKEELKGLGYEI
mgnify:CR=1 FL=1